MKTFLTMQERYRVEGLDARDIKHTQLENLLKDLPALFSVEPVGKSVEGRTIYGVRAGRGITRVMLWSQMHGDESTATRTLLDVFRFLAASDEHNDFREQILGQLSLFFIPMLNPDGAERVQRENAWSIDINRDAQALTTPEGKILHDQLLSFAPQFSFNLHDQNSYYSAGAARTPATIAFLAPPADISESVPDHRRRAMQLINLLNKKLQPIIPGGVAKWSDTYEPRAFGEWSQAQESATILVESGGYYNDPDRNFVRKIHFGILLQALLSIASGDYTYEPIADYYTIPYNREDGLFDRMERQKKIVVNGVSFITDVGFREGETVFGDLDTYGSLEAI